MDDSERHWLMRYEARTVRESAIIFCGLVAVGILVSLVCVLSY